MREPFVAKKWAALHSSSYITQYKDLREVTLRRVARHAALSSLSALGKVARKDNALLATNRVQFIHLHHVFADQLASFRRLLAFLQQRHQFISYSDAVRKIVGGTIDAPYIAVSFDDGIKSCSGMIPALREYGIAACFFVCPTVVGETDFDRVREFCKTRLYSRPVELMSWTDLAGLVADGQEIGSHSMGHYDLASLSRAQLEDEIGGSFHALETKLGHPRHFAWPYGRFWHFSAAAREAVFKTGFQSCASAERGCHTPIAMGVDPAQLCIRRDLAVAGEPRGHLGYFLANNARHMSNEGSQWPQVLQPQGHG
jgi:peptidoglycan/xylan/chitin deacetylase (PgdA/CDA1 family)